MDLLLRGLLHICCGAPYYSNQSEFYSPVQFYSFLKPLTTFKIVFFYSLFFAGTYLVLRKIFQISINASIIDHQFFYLIIIFLHYLSGHIGWGLFSIIPIFLYFCSFILKQIKNILFFLIICASLIFAMMMHSGGSRIIMEILVSFFF